MFDIVAMPTNWPVEVNYHEAKAYCKWKGEDYRLITEAEHHAIRDTEVFYLFFFQTKKKFFQLFKKNFSFNPSRVI